MHAAYRGSLNQQGWEYRDRAELQKRSGVKGPKPGKANGIFQVQGVEENVLYVEKTTRGDI
jgi:hypothetical protein